MGEEQQLPKKKKTAARKVEAVVAAISYLSNAMLLIIYHPTESWPPTTITAYRNSRWIAISNICRLVDRFTVSFGVLSANISSGHSQFTFTLFYLVYSSSNQLKYMKSPIFIPLSLSLSLSLSSFL